MNAGLVRVLLVDDDEDDYVVIKDLLGEVPGVAFALEWAGNYEAGLVALRKRAHDVALIDYRLGPRTGLDLIQTCASEGMRAPLILLTGHGEHELDVEAMRVGAADYLVKGQITALLLERSIRYSIYRTSTLETLRQREENFRSLFDATFEGIVVHDEWGRILDLNRAAAEIFGYSIQEMVGSELDRYLIKLPGRDGAGTAGTAGTGIRRDGGRVHLELAEKPFHHRGAAARLIAMRDVTARKEMEAQMIVQDRLASVGLLASSLAHEIGTPLGVIRGRAEYLALQLSGEGALRKNVDIIVQQIDRVSKLIRSLLNLARGDMSRREGGVLLNKVVSDVLDLMGYELNRFSIAVRNGLAGRGEIVVRAEAESLHQVMLNLLVNSVHAIQAAMMDGRKEGHFIRIGVEDQDESWELTFEDSGCGISRENLKHLFKPFFTTKDIGVGTGLGLATSYRLVDSWGGRISVESDEGRGTTFRVSLPKASVGA